MAKHFLSLHDFTRQELIDLLDLSTELKQLYRSGGQDNCLTGKTMTLLFEKPSSRTRISFEVAMNQLGGSPIYCRPDDVGGLGKREPIKDLARILSGYVDLIVVRTFSHDHIVELAKYSTVPVINALTDFSHPCQAMADMMTIREHIKNLEGGKVTFVGDGNNVARSVAVACAKLGVNFSLAAPADYSFDNDFKELLNNISDTTIECTTDVKKAAESADVLYTDTWISMGQEDEKQQRIEVFSDYKIDQNLMKLAKPDVKIMHCLPAYRGMEITDDAIESENSIVFDQAQNRLHFQRALLKYLCS